MPAVGSNSGSSGRVKPADRKSSKNAVTSQLTDRDTVKIRFNPNKPAEFYLPGPLQSKLARTWKLGIRAVFAILVFIGLVAAWFGLSILNAFSR